MTKEQAVKQASELAYEEDRQMVVGLIEGSWVIRDWEDPESDQLESRIVVGGDGEIYGTAE